MDSNNIKVYGSKLKGNTAKKQIKGKYYRKNKGLQC